MAAAVEPNPSTDEPSPAGQTAPGSALRFVLIPLSFVAGLVALGLFLAWLLSPTASPVDLIRDLGQDHRGNWRKALVLANLLRDPDYAELRSDPAVARQLASLLHAEIEAAQMDDDSIKLRIFLCRALGEFETEEALPELINAGLAGRDPAEVDVQRAAVEAITVVVSQVGAGNVRDDRALLSVALHAGKQFGERRDGGDPEDRLRGSAAFLLGMLGGDRAAEQLVEMLDDPAPDVRFNASTGLARQGRTEAIVVLREMLDPNGIDAVRSESSPEGQDWKRALVLSNALRAVNQLAKNAPAENFESLYACLEDLANADVSRAVQMQARETLHALKSLQSD